VQFAYKYYPEQGILDTTEKCVEEAYAVSHRQGNQNISFIPPTEYKPATTATALDNLNLCVQEFRKQAEKPTKNKGRYEILQPPECFYDLYGEKIRQYTPSF
jgi:hypothetical protein